MLFSNFLLTRPTVDQIHFFLYQKLRLDETFHMVPYMTLYLLKQKFCKVGVCFGEVFRHRSIEVTKLAKNDLFEYKNQGNIYKITYLT